VQAFSFRMPTKVIWGQGCIEQNKAELTSLGKKVLIVTGKKSAKLSGALDDVITSLASVNINYIVFDEVEENPSLETVAKGGRIAFAEKVEFIIGIGGGSPLDASKAIAALGTNNIEAKHLFTGKLSNPVLPIVSIPITAGTGSEVTQYAIITDHEMETKRNFSTGETFPTLAFLDAKYTKTLPYEVTVNTAIDFLSHALEGYLSRRSTPMSDALAKEVFSLFKGSYQALLDNEINLELREKLLYASMLAGVVISQTGTCMVHCLGYPLTYYSEIPHGRANGLVMTEFLRFNYEVAQAKVELFLDLVGANTIEGFDLLITSLLGERKKISDEMLEKYAYSAAQLPAIQFTPRIPTEKELLEVLKRSLS